MIPKISETWRFGFSLSIYPSLCRNQTEAFLAIPDDSAFRTRIFNRDALTNVEGFVPESKAYLLMETFQSIINSPVPVCREPGKFMSPFQFHMFEGQSISNMLQNEITPAELKTLRKMLEKNIQTHPENRRFIDEIDEVLELFEQEDWDSINEIKAMLRPPKFLYRGRWVKSPTKDETLCRTIITYNPGSVRPFFFRVFETGDNWETQPPRYPYFNSDVQTMCIALTPEEFLGKFLIPACDYGKVYREKAAAPLFK